MHCILWHGASVYNGNLWGPLSLIPVGNGDLLPVVTTFVCRNRVSNPYARQSRDTNCTNMKLWRQWYRRSATRHLLTFTDRNSWFFVCLFVCLFRIFRPNRELFTYRHSWPLSSEGSLACHSYCDTGHPFIMVISEDPQHTHLLLSVKQWSCHYLSVAAGIRTHNLPLARWTL